MVLLADECIPAPIVRRLRSEGLDVEYVLEDAPGVTDPDVLARAGRGGRLLLTEDRDFGRLVYLQHAPASPGVIYLRLGNAPLAETVETVSAVLASGIVFRESFTTIEATGHVRQRPLPPPRP